FGERGAATCSPRPIGRLRPLGLPAPGGEDRGPNRRQLRACPVPAGLLVVPSGPVARRSLRAALPTSVEVGGRYGRGEGAPAVRARVVGRVRAVVAVEGLLDADAGEAGDLGDVLDDDGRDGHVHSGVVLLRDAVFQPYGGPVQAVGAAACVGGVAGSDVADGGQVPSGGVGVVAVVDAVPAGHRGPLDAEGDHVARGEHRLLDGAGRVQRGEVERGGVLPECERQTAHGGRVVRLVVVAHVGVVAGRPLGGGGPVDGGE